MTPQGRAEEARICHAVMCRVCGKSGVRLLPSSLCKINKIKYRHATSAYTGVTLAVIPQGSIRKPKAPCLSNHRTKLSLSSQWRKPLWHPWRPRPTADVRLRLGRSLPLCPPFACSTLVRDKQTRRRAEVCLLVVAAKESATRGPP